MPLCRELFLTPPKHGKRFPSLICLSLFDFVFWLFFPVWAESDDNALKLSVLFGSWQTLQFVFPLIFQVKYVRSQQYCTAGKMLMFVLPNFSSNFTRAERERERERESTH